MIAYTFLKEDRTGLAPINDLPWVDGEERSWRDRVCGGKFGFRAYSGVLNSIPYWVGMNRAIENKPVLAVFELSDLVSYDPRSGLVVGATAKLIRAVNCTSAVLAVGASRNELLGLFEREHIKLDPPEMVVERSYFHDGVCIVTRSRLTEQGAQMQLQGVERYRRWLAVEQAEYARHLNHLLNPPHKPRVPLCFAPYKLSALRDDTGSLAPTEWFTEWDHAIGRRENYGLCQRAFEGLGPKHTHPLVSARTTEGEFLPIASSWLENPFHPVVSGGATTAELALAYLETGIGA